MWIKAEDGKLYNAELLRMIEVVSTSEDQSVVRADGHDLLTKRRSHAESGYIYEHLVGKMISNHPYVDLTEIIMVTSDEM